MQQHPQCNSIHVPVDRPSECCLVAAALNARILTQRLRESTEGRAHPTHVVNASEHPAHPLPPSNGHILDAMFGCARAVQTILTRHRVEVTGAAAHGRVPVVAAKKTTTETLRTYPHQILSRIASKLSSWLACAIAMLRVIEHRATTRTVRCRTGE